MVEQPTHRRNTSTMPDTIKVMSFNIRCSTVKKDGENVWPARAQLNVETIRRYSPDLIGFQECDTGNLATYAETLPGYEKKLGPHYNPPEVAAYNACFYKPGFAKVLDDGGFWLSLTPDRYSGDWGTNCNRSAHWTKFELKSGAKFMYLTTHMDHISEQARVEGSKLIVRELARIAGDLPTLVTGDFNCDPGSEAYRTFAAAGFRDTFVESGNKDDAAAYTFHAFKGTRDPNYGRIDWVLIRNGKGSFKAKRTTIIKDAKPPVYPSDHFPVLAEVELA
jgi:endonuclease/exonuclease/phosphatase family metal-dependent hydrolase